MTEEILLARAGTGREKVVVFEGKYHGNLAELLAVADGEGTAPEYIGITEHDIRRTIIVDWNDLDAVARALARGDVALLIVEPLLTNSGVVFPADGFHAGLRRLTREHGTLLAIDATQTLPMAFGGLVREWRLGADFVILGKSLGGGIPAAALGMSEEISSLIEREYAPYEVTGETVDEPAIGGTLFGNALAMAATRAALLEVWTEPTYERTRQLAGSLAAGMESAIRSHERDWNVYHVGNRAGYRFVPTPPRNNQEAGAYDIPAVRHLQRVYMANRGIWEFGWWGPPAISAQASAADTDTDTYLGVVREFLDALLS